ncbi:MAG TPA: TonB C-terminal domain-containing protein [Blastocatellia bacterium]|nr:TonB C-terminal domain-containing protein [Blastocatellia bacterium]
MSGQGRFNSEYPIAENSPRLGILLSVALHAVVLAALLFWFHREAATQIVAAGPGEGGEGGGGSIEVGVADASTILGFARPQPVSFVGDENSAINNARLETSRPEPEQPDEVLPSTEKNLPDKDAIKTDRPVVPQHERIFTGKDERGGSQSQTAQVGRSFGRPTPAMMGGIGLGSGGGFGGGTGLPGGSEYGRRIQAILGRNYNPPAIDAAEVQYVIIRLRIARDGQILSVSGGRVSPAYFKQRSPLAQVNYAAERAILAANPLPPFPAGFLTGVNEAVAEVWFRYPK